jgi:hypothetical protein
MTGFVWNYRIVNTKTANGGEDWYCLQEVIYNDAGKPESFGAPCLGSESMESFGDVWYMMEQAMKHPPLQEEDFVYITSEENLEIDLDGGLSAINE